MSEFVNTVDVLGDDELCDQIILKTLTEYKDNIAIRVGSHAFRSCNSLQYVALPNATEIYDNAFLACKSLETIEIDKVTSIGTNAFYSCVALKNMNAPNITTIKRSFGGCTSLEKICFPAMKNLGDASYNYANSFEGCTSLKTADLPIVNYIGNGIFNKCSNFIALILRNTEAVATLTNVNAFTDTPIASGTGFIYVPSALIESYKVATNWSTYANQFRALEDYTVDGTITGELDESKI